MIYCIVTVDWLISKGFIIKPEWRKSVDGTKVILHYDFVTPVLKDGEVIEEYYSGDNKLFDLLNSPEWTKPKAEI